MKRNYIIAFLIVFAVLFFDQWLKIWVKTSMIEGEEFSVIGDWFRIHFVENRGMAFGIELFSKLFLTLIRIIASIGIIWYLNSLIKAETKRGVIICISLILAGAVGNIIDSVFYGVIFTDSINRVAEFMPEVGYETFMYGNVVDMFYFPIIDKAVTPEFLQPILGSTFTFFNAIFNLADAAITVGVLVLLIFFNKDFLQKEEKKEEEEETAEKEVETVV